MSSEDSVKEIDFEVKINLVLRLKYLNRRMFFFVEVRLKIIFMWLGILMNKQF